MAILRVLGMVDERALVFPDPNARYDFDRDSVYFSGLIGDESVSCSISREALEDHFEPASKNLVQMYQANAARINHEVSRKYLAEKLETDGSVSIRSEDF